MPDNCMDGMAGASADKALVLILYEFNEPQGNLHALLLSCSDAGETLHTAAMYLMYALIFSISHTLCRGL